jgi:polysaccharide deacetylase family protein (PEP-CTERM system associated)
MDARFILSVDVEDYFQVEAFSRDIRREDWDQWPSRVVDNTKRLLDLYDEYDAKATFFILGWVAHKFPGLVRDIVSRGHEPACHSYWHRLVYSLTPEKFRQDLRDARHAIEQAGGVPVRGYRAPSWSINASCLWALDVLAEDGFSYDSSIYPIRHDVYGMPQAKRFPHHVPSAHGHGLTEFPPATVRIWDTNLPTAGGGYLRILPLWYTEWSLRRLAAENGEAVVVYVHPWEIDPQQPRVSTRWKSKLRHYTNLATMEGKLRHLLATRQFQPFRNVMAEASAAAR